MTLDGIIYAPFTDKQILSLIERQMRTDLHPYTCLRHSDTRLIPTRDGFRCAEQYCDYQQVWAHESIRPHYQKES